MSSSTLLLVDDHPLVLQLRRQNLERFGYSVLMASNANSAVSLLEKTPVAVVLVEYKSEGIDAEAVAHHIKGRFPAQPIVLLSAYSAIPERILWLVDEYVMRSDPIETLIKRIERLANPRKTAKARKAAVVANSSTLPNRFVA